MPESHRSHAEWTPERFITWAATIGPEVAELAGKIIVVTTKKVGRAIASGQSVGTIESSKWVGPIPSPLTGEIVAVNSAPQEDPAILNRDPYSNWIVRLQPSNWEGESGELVTGSEGVDTYRRLLQAEGIDCGS